MKFGRDLEEGIEAKFKSWRTYAVNYNAMKQLIPEEEQQQDGSDEWKIGGSEYMAFWDLYDQSKSSMTTFYEEKLEESQVKLRNCQSRLAKLRLSQLPPRNERDGSLPNVESMESMKQNLVEFQEDLELILEFFEINHTAFRKILKKYDKKTSSTVKEEKMSQLLETHVFLFGGGVITDIQAKSEALMNKFKQIEFDTKSGNTSGTALSRQTQPIHRRLSQKTLDRAKSILNDMDQSPMFTSNKVRRNPTYLRQEIEIGKYLGEGEFGIVHEIIAFHVKDTCPICFLYQGLNKELPSSGETTMEASIHGSSKTKKITSYKSNEGFCLNVKEGDNVDIAEFEDDHVEESEELTSNRGFMKEHCFRKNVTRYAIKEVKTSLDGPTLADGALDICIEAKFLSVISHPNIIKLCGMSKIRDGDPRTFIVLDRLYDTLGCRIGSWTKDTKKLSKGLFASLKHKKELEWLWNERLLAMYDIARAMKYLHSNEIMYRDLKPENAGFDVRGNVKLFDFGLAKELQPKDRIGENQYNASGRTGTRRYMSPEVALCKPYGKPADVYSFGILFWETLALEQPFQGFGYEKHAKDVVQKGKRLPISKDWPTFIKSLTSESWAPNPSERPNFDRICSIIKGELVTVDLNLSDRTNDLMDVSLTNRDLHRPK